MGEVGGSFNERKNEITRKSRMCPTKNDTNIVFIKYKEDVLFHHWVLSPWTGCILIFLKEAAIIAEMVTSHVTRTEANTRFKYEECI